MVARAIECNDHEQTTAKQQKESFLINEIQKRRKLVALAVLLLNYEIERKNHKRKKIWIRK